MGLVICLMYFEEKPRLLYLKNSEQAWGFKSVSVPIQLAISPHGIYQCHKGQERNIFFRFFP